jgi:hypothetical protein
VRKGEGKGGMMLEGEEKAGKVRSKALSLSFPLLYSIHKTDGRVSPSLEQI